VKARAEGLHVWEGYGLRTSACAVGKLKPDLFGVTVRGKEVCAG
jgi:hypothetical protein